jgi:chitin disaccharide deacetylase
MPKHTPIALCADDFGLSQNVSSGIIDLATLARLTAVGCMVNMPDFKSSAPGLKALHHQVQIGLHFNLTEGLFISKPDTICYGLNALLLKTHLGLRPKLFVQEFNAQLDRFIEVMGFMPDFIDGHQHIHQFPGIRQAVLQVYQHRLKAHDIHVRATYPSLNLPPYQLKARILAAAGGKTLQAQLMQANIPHNPYFTGIYDFNPAIAYRTLFRRWLSMAQPNTLFMCHPAKGLDVNDSITRARVNEYTYFLSDGWLHDCEEYHCYLHAQNLATRKL